mgnify:CR=1 FL=1
MANNSQSSTMLFTSEDIKRENLKQLLSNVSDALIDEIEFERKEGEIYQRFIKENEINEYLKEVEKEEAEEKAREIIDEAMKTAEAKVDNAIDKWVQKTKLYHHTNSLSENSSIENFFSGCE